jgi:hypothetical protein
MKHLWNTVNLQQTKSNCGSDSYMAWKMDISKYQIVCHIAKKHDRHFKISKNRMKMGTSKLYVQHFINISWCGQATSKLLLKFKYSNPSVYEQLVYEFSLVWDAQINAWFFNLQAIRAPSSRKLIVIPDVNGKLIFVLQVFASQAVLEERIKLINQGITIVIFPKGMQKYRICACISRT